MLPPQETWSGASRVLSQVCWGSQLPGPCSRTPCPLFHPSAVAAVWGGRMAGSRGLGGSETWGSQGLRAQGLGTRGLPLCTVWWAPRPRHLGASTPPALAPSSLCLGSAAPPTSSLPSRGPDHNDPCAPFPQAGWSLPTFHLTHCFPWAGKLLLSICLHAPGHRVTGSTQFPSSQAHSGPVACLRSHSW